MTWNLTSDQKKSLNHLHAIIGNSKQPKHNMHKIFLTVEYDIINPCNFICVSKTYLDSLLIQVIQGLSTDYPSSFKRARVCI